MKKRIGLFVGAALLLLAVPGTLLTVRGAPDGLPDVSGDWEGTAKSKIYDTSTGGGKESEKIGLAVTLVQRGPSLSATISVPDDPRSPPFTLTGTIGNGHFFLSGEQAPGDPIVIVGHVKKGKKIKGTGLSSVDGGSEVTEFTIKLKRAD